jgi:hypothetical protein
MRLPPFALIHDEVSTETVECLRSLLKRAERGEVVGLTYCVMFKRRHYAVNVLGEAHRNPTFTRGMVAALDDHLADLTRKQG